MKKFDFAADVNKGTLPATPTKLNESDVNDFIGNRTFAEITKVTSTSTWDGQPLVKDHIYHLDEMGGLPILWIKANRRSFKRAEKMFKACKENAMTTSALVTDAKIVADYGLSLIDPGTQDVVPADQLDGKYCIFEGHGRCHGVLIALAESAQSGEKPFDFHFVYKQYDSSEAFGKAYISTNADMTRTTSKDRLSIVAARSKDPLVISYLSRIENDQVISKSSFFWTFGRELTKNEVSKLIMGDSGAPTFKSELTDALNQCYEAFKEQFAARGAEKIYRGVAAAQWCADRIGKAKDKAKTAQIICQKVKGMDKNVFVAIITASTSKKKHVTRDQVIKTELDNLIP